MTEWRDRTLFFSKPQEQSIEYIQNKEQCLNISYWDLKQYGPISQASIQCRLTDFKSNWTFFPTRLPISKFIRTVI